MITHETARQASIERLSHLRLSPIAVHEAGHAVAACAYRIRFDRVVLHRVPRRAKQSGQSGGLIGGEVVGLVNPLRGRSAMKARTVNLRLSDQIAVLLAGREAMEHVFGASCGYDNDYAQAYELLALRSPTAPTADRDVMIDGLRERAANLMRKKMVELIVIAHRLQETRVLSYEEIRHLYGVTTRSRT